MTDFSLESEVFKEIEANLEFSLEKFYSGKRTIQISPKEALSSFKKSTIPMKRFLHEYGMGFISHWDRRNEREIFYIKGELSAEFQKYIIYVSRFLCSRGPGLKPAYTIQGKNAEGMVLHAINNWLHYFNFPNRLKFNSKSFAYGGDGGYDFALGQYRYDVKHRDDGPNSGLILGERYLERAPDDVILIFTTNATNIKLGDSFNKQSVELTFSEVTQHLAEQVFPLALSGWMPVGDFKKKMAERPGNQGREIRYVVDELYPINDLFFLIMEDQIESSDMFG